MDIEHSVDLGSLLYDYILSKYIKNQNPFDNRIYIEIGDMFNIDFGPYKDSPGIYQPDLNTIVMSFHKNNEWEPLSIYPLNHPFRKSIFIHEFQHFVDCKINKIYNFIKGDVFLDKSYGIDYNYYNRRVEINAYIAQAYFLHDNIDEFIKGFPILKFYTSLSIKNRKKVIRKLYKLYDSKKECFLY